MALNWQCLETAVLRTDPFDHVHVLDAVNRDDAAAISGEFPEIRKPGSFSLHDAPPGPVLSDLIGELESDRFRALMSRHFGLDLTPYATTVTIRGACGARDGNIHTDSKTKILSLLLYLNEGWAGGDGQLRLLRNGQDINAVAVEIPAAMGSLVVFRRADNSWHGHTRYSGERRVLQFNYVVSERTTMISEMRHRLSALLKGRQAA
jgi:hypothetical protein